MQFLIDEGRGQGYDEAMADAVRESAARLTAAGVQPSAVVLTEAQYVALAGEVPHLPGLPDAKQSGVQFDGMRIHIIEAEA